MIGTIIGGIVLGGVIANYNEKKRQKREEESEAARCYRELYDRYQSLHSSVAACYAEKVQAENADKKLKRQVEFFDEFRELDNKLARSIRKGFKGVTYLIKGMEVAKSNRDLQNCFKSIRNYRGQLSHDKRKWKDIPAPSDSLMNDLYQAKRWVENNYSYASHLVYKGERAFSRETRR